ncbi:MAG TPA: cobalamin-binding protein [Bacteroidetes bacterium]|nr:cobalamin-binding protein [Bacteroidota bacterium]
MEQVFTDQMGRQISIPFPPKRIISLVPSQTEFLFDLGLKEEVVGITKFCVHPREMWKSKPRIGGTKQLHFDKIAALKPGLIIGNKEENDRSQIEKLQARYPVWMSDINTKEDALQMMEMLGKVTDRQAEANLLISKINAAFAKLGVLVSKNKRPKAAYFIWRKPYMAAAKDTYIDAMMAAAGFQNVFSDKIRYPEVSLAEVARRRPDVVLLSSEPYPFSEKHFDEIKKHCRGAVIFLADGEMFSWYGSRMLPAAGYFANLRADVFNALNGRTETGLDTDGTDLTDFH